MRDLRRQTRLRNALGEEVDVIESQFTEVIVIMDREDLDKIIWEFEAKNKYFDNADLEAAKDEAYTKGRKEAREEIKKALNGVLPL